MDSELSCSNQCSNSDAMDTSITSGPLTANEDENSLDYRDRDKHTASSSSFLIDRSLIQKIQHDRQDAELQDLEMELSVYHQEELEQGILAQVDQALEQQEREQEKRRIEKQLKEVEENIRTTEQRLSQDDVMLQVMRGATTSVAKAFTARQERNRRQEQLENLRAKQQELTKRRSALDGDSKSEINATGILEKSGAEESEQERLIRLGEMTPFGTVLTQQSKSDEKLSDFEKYLQSQAALEKSRTKKSPISKNNTYNAPVASTSKETPEKRSRKSALKTSVLDPKKRKHKNKLGSKTLKHYRGDTEPGLMLSETQTMNLDSDPDFEPDLDDDDDEEFIPKLSDKKKKTVKCMKRRKAAASTKMKDSDSDWHTDDSDWQSSGDEGRVIKKRKKGQEMDDGEAATYTARLRLWEKEIGEDRGGSHRLDGGLEVPNYIWQKLYKYQQVGVQWMWELHQNGTGGILGDEMGLGKTIQVIAFLAALKASQLKDIFTGFRGLGPSLIVCPTTVMHQWVKEFHAWWPPLRVAILHESGSFGGSRVQLIKEMAQNRGILITSYQGLVKHQEALLKYNWHLLVLDEGHKIRNPDAQATLAAKSIPTPHRIALTGSPMQNNLRELWSLFDFVYPSKLGTLPDFLANFAVPITQGGYANATEVQVATAYHCALTLKEIIKPYLLRRMKNDVKKHINLPNKNEQVLFCKLTEEQRALYRHYVDSRLFSNIVEGKTKIFVGLINLRKICNHPDLFSGRSKLTKDDESLPKDERYGYWEHSGKMQVIHSLLKIWYKQGHRVLLFTQGRQMMCILENFIQQEGYNYLKLDGSTSVATRQPLITEFNNNPEHFVFLLTTKVGGLGVNLTGADRVIIFDPDWNPATDTQARERAWRIGQERQVTIYRLVTAGTIEEKIYHRQIFKQFLTNKVLHDPRQRRFFKSNDLYELFTLNEGEERGTETSALFAGTGSEIKLKPKRPKAPSPQPVIPNKIEFSQEKIDHMKQLAQRLSQQFAMKLANKSQSSLEGETSEMPSKTDVSVTATSAASTECTSGNTKTTSIKKSNVWCTSDDSLKENVKLNNGPKTEMSSDMPKASSSSKKTDRKEKESHKGKHKEKKRHRKGTKFEGERVSYLVKCREYSKLLNSDKQEEEKKDENQDDYVLRKLFKKSGLQTALKHDHIMDGGGADVALIEREARHVAQEAITRLKESQRRCFNASAGIPSWTGASGHIRISRSTESTKKKPSAALGKAPEPEKTEEDKPEEKMISAKDLILKWHKHNRLMSAPSPNAPASPEVALDSPDTDNELREEDAELEVLDAMYEDFDPREPHPAAPPVPHRPQEPAPTTRSIFITDEEKDLLDEIRAFLSFGASTDGQASTEELLARFPNSELSPSMTPLFKCLLQSLADFHRTPDGQGIWTLKSEFR